MIALIAILLTLIPAIAITYPFLRRRAASEYLEDEGSPQAELARRWDAAIAGLKSAELEWAIGNLAEDDYRWLRQRYMTDAATIIKAMEVEEAQEQALLADIERELEEVRLRALGTNGVSPLVTCPGCSYGIELPMDDCPNCGLPLVEARPAQAHSEAAGE